jgi:dihydroflavonol-4-reductase
MGTVFITGATGFVGLNVLRKLRGRGERVRALARPGSEGARFVKKFGATIVPGDITDYASVRKAIRGCDRVYHVAGSTEMSPAKRAETEAINVGGTRNVMRAALEENVERAVHTSSTAAVGGGPPERPATEKSPWNYRGLHLPYNDTKREGERVALEFNRKGLKVVVVNPAYMIGEWDVKPTSGELILIAAKFGIPLYPPGSNNVLDVEDAADGHLLAMERGRPGQRYILGHENLSYREILATICRAVDRPGPFLPLPHAAARVAGLVGDLLQELDGGEALSRLNSGTARLAFVDHCVSPALAVRELGLPQRPVEGAVAKAVRWFKKHRYL